MEGALEIQQELTRAKEAAMKKTMSSYIKGKQNRDFIEFLQNEVQKAKESETKMLESLVSQTKQLEQTKISFEECKLEIESLHESIKMQSLNKKQSDELKLALEAEEQSKKAMDSLALALIEVSNDLNQTKDKLRSTEEKLRETEELYFASCHEKEAAFISCVKASEDEVSEIREENKRLMEMNRASREEISKLRDILKQAVNDATSVKEALETVKAENFQKDDALNLLKEEFESLRRMRRQNSWGEMEGFEGRDESPLMMKSGKEGKSLGFDGKFEWISNNKQKKKRQFLRSFSDILRRKSCQR